MRTQTTRLVWAVVAALPLAIVALAQERVPEKDAKYLLPSHASIVDSSLCRHAREHSSEMDWKLGRKGLEHLRVVDPATLASDLTGLMTISDEVVLAGISIQDSNAIAPSGEDAIHSLQVKVLHAWKGDLKVGQTIMFSVPSAMLSCATSEPDYEGPVFATRTGDERWGEGYPKGPFVLFLRHSQGPEKELTPDLRLAGGDGIQGMFYIDYFVYPGVTTPGKPSAANGKAQFSMAERFALIKPCNSVLDGGTVKCLEYLKTGKDWIRIQHESDPLLKKYEGMETGKFFEEVDSVSRSLGYTTLLLEDR